jgi:hypothetical protein
MQSTARSTGANRTRKLNMKFVAAATLGALMALAGPALAQNKDMSKMDDKAKAPAHHVVHRARYKRDYKTDREEEQQTKDLNSQYRGVNSSDAH